MTSQFLVTFLFVCAVAIPTVRCNKEVDSLLAWKNTLEDPDNNLQSWRSDSDYGFPELVDPCEWFHITCDNHQTLKRVDLGDKRLLGTLSAELGNLNTLEYLMLFKNKLNGPIPTELGQLTNLKSLDLSGNELTGPIPESLGNLKSLRFLRLNDNRLTGTIPESVKALFTNGNLRVLNITNNQLSGPVH